MATQWVMISWEVGTNQQLITIQSEQTRKNTKNQQKITKKQNKKYRIQSKTVMV